MRKYPNAEQVLLSIDVGIEDAVEVINPCAEDILEFLIDKGAPAFVLKDDVHLYFAPAFVLENVVVPYRGEFIVRQDSRNTEGPGFSVTILHDLYHV